MWIDDSVTRSANLAKRGPATSMWWSSDAESAWTCMTVICLPSSLKKALYAMSWRSFSSTKSASVAMASFSCSSAPSRTSDVSTYTSGCTSTSRVWGMAGRSVSRKGEPPRSAPQRPRVYALRAAAFGAFGVGEGVIMLEKFLDTGDLAVLDQRHLPVVERHLVAGSFYACGEADLRHGAIADLGQLAQVLSESVDRVEPVLEVAANAFMPSEGAGVWGILGSLPEDVLREEVEPVVEPPGLGRLVGGQNHVAGQPYVGAVGHPPRIYSVGARSGSASRHAHPPFRFRMILSSARQADFHRSRVPLPMDARATSDL